MYLTRSRTANSSCVCAVLTSLAFWLTAILYASSAWVLSDSALATAIRWVLSCSCQPESPISTSRSPVGMSGLRPWTSQPPSIIQLLVVVLTLLPSDLLHPPILIGGLVDRGLKRAAVGGDGLLTYFDRPESFAKSWNKIRGFAKEAGKGPDSLLNASQLP